MNKTEESAGRQLLRLTTAGSVDDGKSTLIGRLLADSGALTVDQLATLAAMAVREGREEIDYARVTDGLTAEREQGITIDVAYRYFATARRSFVIADVPGHEQYTRNMVTGASHATAALFVLDARHGVKVQTRRHVYIAGLLGIADAVFAINKMDLVDWSERRFDALCAEIMALTAPLGFATRHVVPVSARRGDNVVGRSAHAPWYDGRPLLDLLETLPAAPSRGETPFRMPVQIAAPPEPGAGRDRRGYMGRIASGRVRVGDRVRAAPGPLQTTVAGIVLPDGPVDEAGAGQSVTVILADEIDAGRGTLLADAAAAPREDRELTATLCWLGASPQNPRAPYLLRIGTREVAARLGIPETRIDIDSFRRVPGERPLAANDIGTARIRLQHDIAFDAYGDNKATGAFIVIDARTNDTVAAGMIEHAL